MTKNIINNTEYNDQRAFDAANNRFVAPVAGTYLFGASLFYKINASTTARMNGRLVLNGTAEIRGGEGVNAASHWDGDAGPKDHGIVGGGPGIWQNSAGNDNWTDTTGAANAPFAELTKRPEFGRAQGADIFLDEPAISMKAFTFSAFP